MTDLMCINLPFEHPFKIDSFSRPSRSPCKTRGGTIYYPVVLASMTGYAERKGYSVQLIDCVADRISFDELLKRIEIYNPKAIVLDTSTTSIVNDIYMGDIIQKKFESSKVVLVGRHVTYAPKETLETCSAVSIVARGEFYEQVIRILKGIPNFGNDGISYKILGNITHNKNAELVNPEEFGLLSNVYKRHLTPKNYFYSSIRNPYIMLQVGWGCPYNCSFCNEVVKNNYRHRSVKHVLDEIRFVKEELPFIREILWDDPTYVVDEKFIRKLSDSMVRENLVMNHSCMTRANISYYTLESMKAAGFKTAHIGLESANQSSLDVVNKNANFEKEVKYLERCGKLGIKNHVCWIVGLPGDTKESVRATMARANTLPSIDTIQVFPLIPTPFEDIFGKESEGTIWKYLIDNNYLTTRDYSKWLNSNGLYNCVINYPQLSSTDINNLVEEFYREFYYRPNYMWKKFKQSLTSWDEFSRNLRGFKTMVTR